MALTVKKQQEEFQGLTVRKKVPIPCTCKHERRDHDMAGYTEYDWLPYSPCDKCNCSAFKEMDSFQYIRYVKRINERIRHETLKSRSSKV